jgi:hypothetical protein
MRFTDKQNDLALVVGWADYFRATGKIPMEAQVQQAWYFALHPEMGGGQESVFFPNLRVQHRAEQKRRLNQVIETARMDEVKMSHSATERRLRWPRLTEQFFRVDKWSVCRG